MKSYKWYNAQPFVSFNTYTTSKVNFTAFIIEVKLTLDIVYMFIIAVSFKTCLKFAFNCM